MRFALHSRDVIGLLTAPLPFFIQQSPELQTEYLYCLQIFLETCLKNFIGFYFVTMTNKPQKVCFVTIGATAPFDTLLSKVLDDTFLEALKNHEYTRLLIQYGKEGRAIFDSFIRNAPPESPARHGLVIQGFGFRQEGLLQEMRSTKSNQALNTAEGMILSHAGKLSSVDS